MTGSTNAATTASRTRIATLAVATAGAALVTVVNGIAFSAWVDEDNAIYFPHVEEGRPEVYPANHFLYGDALALGLGTGVALLAAALVLLAASVLRRRMPHPAAVVWLAASVGLAVPITLRYSVYLAFPAVASAISAAIVVAWMLRRGLAQLTAPSAQPAGRDLGLDGGASGADLGAEALPDTRA